MELKDDLPEVLVISANTDPQVLGEFLMGHGPAPQGSHEESYEEFAARGRAEDCDCELIECVCTLARAHHRSCKFRRALTCAIPISCDDHGFDVCPTCDPCTCRKEA